MLTDNFSIPVSRQLTLRCMEWSEVFGDREFENRGVSPFLSGSDAKGTVDSFHSERDAAIWISSRLLYRSGYPDHSHLRATVITHLDHVVVDVADSPRSNAARAITKESPLARPAESQVQLFVCEEEHSAMLQGCAWALLMCWFLLVVLSLGVVVYLSTARTYGARDLVYFGAHSVETNHRRNQTQSLSYQSHPAAVVPIGPTQRPPKRTLNLTTGTRHYCKYRWKSGFWACLQLTEM